MNNIIKNLYKIKDLELDISVTNEIIDEISDEENMEYFEKYSKQQYLKELLDNHKKELKNICTNTVDLLYDSRESISNKRFLVFNNYLMHIYRHNT
jgi:hypothetical protein